MEAGTLRHRVTIQQPVAASSSYGKGAKKPTWTDVATVSAFVRPLRAGEIIRAGQTGMETAYVVKMRYTSALKAEHRLAWDGRILYVQGIIPVGGRRIELEVLCSEREPANG